MPALVNIAIKVQQHRLAFGITNEAAGSSPQSFGAFAVAACHHTSPLTRGAVVRVQLAERYLGCVK